MRHSDAGGPDGVRQDDRVGMCLALVSELLSVLRSKGALTEADVGGIVLAALHGTSRETLDKRAGDPEAEIDVDELLRLITQEPPADN